MLMSVPSESLICSCEKPLTLGKPESFIGVVIAAARMVLFLFLGAVPKVLALLIATAADFAWGGGEDMEPSISVDSLTDSKMESSTIYLYC